MPGLCIRPGAVRLVVVCALGVTCGALGVPALAAARPRPQTVIVAKPPARTDTAVAVIRFRSSQRHSTFRCWLDGRRHRPCRSPLRLRGLKPGRHVVRVRARSRSGLRDRTPAVVRWTVLARAVPIAAAPGEASAPAPTPTPTPPKIPPAPPAGNLWIDTDGGSCTRQATPGDYVDAQACGSFSSALQAAQPGDAALVRCTNGTSCTFPPEDLSGDRGAGANVVIAAARGYSVSFEEAAASGDHVSLDDLHHVTFQDIGFGHANTGDSSPNLRIDCTRDVTLINSTGRRFYMFEGNANVTFLGGDWGGYSSPGEEDSTMGTTGAAGPQTTCPGDSAPRPQRNIVFDGVAWHDVFYLSSCTFVNGGQCAEWGSAHPDCFEINGYVDGVTIQNSTFSHCGNTMLSLYTDQGQIDNVVVRNNTFRDMSDDTYFGMQWVTTADFTCSGNQFVGNMYTPNDPGAWTPNAPPRFECKAGAVPTLVWGNTFQAAPSPGDCATSKAAPYLTTWKDNTFGSGSC